MSNAKLEENKIGVHLATTPEEIEAAQRLRYKVFYEEQKAKADSKTRAEKKDIDLFDGYADHLIVTDKSLKQQGKEDIVGTYRLLRRDVVEKHGKFYSSCEYDLSKLLNTNSNLLELGRSCVLPEYRTKAVLQLLWEGIAQYTAQHNIDVLFGCGSLHGTDTQKLATALSYMYHYHKADEEICVKALPEQYIDMNIIPKEEINIKSALTELPPLIKGYLRIGAMVGDGAVIDHQFNTTDVFIVMPTQFVAERYKNHYERKTQQPLVSNDEEKNPPENQNPSQNPSEQNNAPLDNPEDSASIEARGSL